MRAPRSAALAFVWTGAALFAASLAVFAYAYLVRFGRPAPDGPVLLPVVFDAALFSAFALHHSVFARDRPRAWMTRLVPPGLERSAYVWIASLLFSGVCLAWQPVPGILYSLPAAAAAIGYVIQGIGFALTARASRTLGVLDLAGLQAVAAQHTGRGAEAALTTSGLYAFVRHPLYFAWLLIVFGAPHMTMTRFVFAVVSTAYLAVAVPFEERALIKTFGDGYRAYREKVRWRMVPGIY